MSDAFTWIIRFIHILSGVTWLGGALLWGTIVAPNVLQRGPPAIRRPFLEAVLAKVTHYFIFAGGTTILSGFWIMGILVGWDSIVGVLGGGGGYPASYGIALGVGVVAALVMYAIGLFVIKPTGHKLLTTMQAMPAGGPPPAETQAQLGALGKKIGMASMATLALGTIALAGMVWAVNTVR